MTAMAIDIFFECNGDTHFIVSHYGNKKEPDTVVIGYRKGIALEIDPMYKDILKYGYNYNTKGRKTNPYFFQGIHKENSSYAERMKQFLLWEE